MKFLTPAFVRVGNPQERKELIEWLRSIGYSLTYGAQVSDIDNGKEFVEVVSGTVYVAKWGNSFRDYNAHDCDENINLFKALAAMNSENDREQWFVCIKSHACGCDDDGEYYHVGELSRFWDNRTPTANLWRKAAVEEIINHFKNQRS